MKNFELRIPQDEAQKAFFDYYESGKRGNPIICMFTGLGKSYALAYIMLQMIRRSKNAKIIVLTHSEKVLVQDYNAFYDLLCFYNEFATIGMYSSKLNKKELDCQVTFATIGSVYKKPELFPVNYVFVDECHLVSDLDDTMYRKFLADKGKNVCGLTATPFRMKKGYLHEMENSIFTDLIYDTNTPEKFAQMIELGYIVKPVREPTALTMETKGIAKTGGDFNLKGLSKALDRDNLTSKIVKDMLKYKDSHKHWFIFAIDKKHSENISRELNSVGITADFVHSSKEEDNDIAIKKFREGKIQALVSVMMLTTGVDIPQIDLIGCLRPTDSVVIHIQSIGRGLRAFPGKTECLVLDYAGNTVRNGPIDSPVIRVAGKGKAGGKMEKDCPECDLKHHISVRKCDCGHEFTFKTKLETSSSEASLTKQRAEKKWVKVNSAHYYLHKKMGKPNSLRIEYLSGLRRYPLWIMPFHGGFASRSSNHIFNRLKTVPIKYEKIEDILKQVHTLKVPTEIYLDVTEKYPFIEDFKFGD